jgi:CheY-like chemotaxis protein
VQIADDNHDTRECLCPLLSRWGFEGKTAADGLEGFTAATRSTNRANRISRR